MGLNKVWKGPPKKVEMMSPIIVSKGLGPPHHQDLKPLIYDVPEVVCLMNAEGGFPGEVSS